MTDLPANSEKPFSHFQTLLANLQGIHRDSKRASQTHWQPKKMQMKETEMPHLVCMGLANVLKLVFHLYIVV